MGQYEHLYQISCQSIQYCQDFSLKNKNINQIVALQEKTDYQNHKDSSSGMFLAMLAFIKSHLLTVCVSVPAVASLV